jgi:site-specific recombinase XerD
MMTETTTLPAVAERKELVKADILDAFASFLRLNVAQGDASPETIRSYHAHVGQFVDWCGDHGVNPAMATEEELERYRAYLTGAGYERGTIGVKLSVVRRLYQAATWRGLRTDNPAAGLKAPKERGARADRVKYLPLAGFRLLMDAPDKGTMRGKRDRAILALLGYHGLRVSEVASLTVDDLHLGDPAWVTVTGKGNKTRQVYLTTTTRKTLETWLAARPSGPGHRHVFVTLDNRTRGEPLSGRSIRNLIDGYLEGLGLKKPGISCHSLRHSFATWSLAGGAKLESIQDTLGHASVETTQVYAKIVDRMRENPTLYLEKLLSG